MENRACSLVRAVSAKVEDNASIYEKLIEILSKDGEFYKDLLAELQEILESFQSSTGEQHVNTLRLHNVVMNTTHFLSDELTDSEIIMTTAHYKFD